MLGQRRKRWSNIEPAFSLWVQRFLYNLEGPQIVNIHSLFDADGISGTCNYHVSPDVVSSAEKHVILMCVTSLRCKEAFVRQSQQCCRNGYWVSYL